MAAVLETRLRHAQTEKITPLDLVSMLVSDELLRRQDRLLERRHKQARFRDPDPTVGIRASGSIEQSLREFYSRPRFELATLGTFSGFALVLALIGVFGVMSYAVSRRTRELGIRKAIGASGAVILRLIVTQATKLVALGIIFGVSFSFLLSRLLGQQITSLNPPDARTMSLVVGLIAIVAIGASLSPAVRAARTNVLNALREN